MKTNMITSNLSKRFTILGLVLGLVSAFLLYSGPDARPIEDRTFNGQSESELRYTKEIQRKDSYGFMFLGLSFFAQLMGLLSESPTSKKVE